MGIHTIFIGEIIDGDIISDGEPMTYACYHMVRKDKAPKAANSIQGTAVCDGADFVRARL